MILGPLAFVKIKQVNSPQSQCYIKILLVFDTLASFIVGNIPWFFFRTLVKSGATEAEPWASLPLEKHAKLALLRGRGTERTFLSLRTSLQNCLFESKLMTQAFTSA